MIAIIIFLGLIIGLNCIPLLTKATFPKVEKIVVRILIASTVLFLTFTILQFSGYRLKGLYTFPTFGWIFIISSVLFFAIFKNTKKKILTVCLLTPLIVLSILTLILGQIVYEKKIDETNKISVSTGGFLACGEIINITQTRFGIFDKQVFHIDNLCLIGINKIETVKLDDKHAEFLIYHNGQYDSENPYKFDVERNNVW
jgi:ABC-2 type transport system permease protein